MPDALERLTNLLALLLETRVPLTLEQIDGELAGQYPVVPSARRGAFERDKAVLRELGVPIDGVVLSGDQAGRTAYRIDRSRYELTDLDLADDEQHALQLAVATVRSSDARFGMLKLGGAASGSAAVMANVPELADLPVLREAVAARAGVSFEYRGVDRQLEPYALMLREGYWYVLGRDRAREAVRTYRVDRIDGPVTTGPGGEFERPADFDPRTTFPSDPKELGDEPAAKADVLVDRERSPTVLRELGDVAVVERRDDGAVVVRVACANLDAFRSWLFGLASHAEALRPPEVRDDVVAWLTEMTATADEGRRAPAVREAKRRPVPTIKHGPRSTADRLRRLLVMLPWLMERGEVAVTEVARRFEVTEAELVRDLEMAAMCGLPPFVDEMVDLFIDEGMIRTGVPRLFTRSLRLTAPEGFALLTAGRAAMELPGADRGGALARALAKLGAALGDDGVVVDAPQPPATGDVAAAVVESARLRITYWSAGRDEVTERELTPRAVFLDRGNWYVVGDDHRSGEQRTFRLDRFERWERTGIIDEPREGVIPTGDNWFAGSDLPQVTLVVDETASWVVERYPVVGCTETSSGVEITLSVTGERWLTALLLRLGPHASVVAPAEWRDLGQRAAARLLSRYEAAPS